MAATDVVHPSAYSYSISTLPTSYTATSLALLPPDPFPQDRSGPWPSGHSHCHNQPRSAQPQPAVIESFHDPQSHSDSHPVASHHADCALLHSAMNSWSWNQRGTPGRSAHSGNLPPPTDMPIAVAAPPMESRSSTSAVPLVLRPPPTSGRGDDTDVAFKTRSAIGSERSLRASTEHLHQWFAEMVCFLWFAPASSNLYGTSLPVSPARSPTTSFAPTNTPQLSLVRQNVTHSKARSQDYSFSNLSATPDRQLGPITNLENNLRFHTDDQRLLPQPRFIAFIRDALNTTQVSTSVLILALLYIQRLKRLHTQIKGQDGSEYRVGVTALVLANKFLDDHTYTNKTWSSISGIALKDLTKLEIEFWLGLQMRIHVEAKDYEKWLRALENLAGQRQQLLRRRAQDISRRRAFLVERSTPRAALRFRNSISYGQAAQVAASVQSGLPADITSPFSGALSHGQAVSTVASTPSSALEAASSSPTSQRSQSTTATSVTGPWYDGTHKVSPETSFNSRHPSPLDTSSLLLQYPHASSSLSASTSRSIAEPFRQEANAQGSRKRGRGHSEDEDGAPSPKRAGHFAPRHEKDEEASLRPVPQSAGPSHAFDGNQSTALPRLIAPVSTYATHQPSQNPRLETAALQDANSINAEGANLYRSIFAQPLTPEGLMQAYSGPTETSRVQNRDRQMLSFYQLAAGRGPGLPAYHLPAPPPPPADSWASGRSASARRNMLRNSSPRFPTASHPGYHTSSVGGPPAQIVRLSPEAYGMTYGYPGPRLNPGQLPTAPSSCSGSPLDRFSLPAAGEASAAASDACGDRRWVPFCNVPIAMQLQHYQQWQQLNLPYTNMSASHGNGGYGHGHTPSW